MSIIKNDFVKDLLIHEIEVRNLSLTDLAINIDRVERLIANGDPTDEKGLKLCKVRLENLRNEERRTKREIEALKAAVEKL